jgi:hypothetical protein
MYYQILDDDGNYVIVQGRRQVAAARHEGYRDVQKLPRGTKLCPLGTALASHLVDPEGRIYRPVTRFPERSRP